MYRKTRRQWSCPQTGKFVLVLKRCRMVVCLRAEVEEELTGNESLKLNVLCAIDARKLRWFCVHLDASCVA